MKQQVSPGVVAGAIIVVVAIIGVVIYMFLIAPNQKPPDTRATDPRYQQYLKTGVGSGGSAGGQMQGSPNTGSPNTGGSPDTGGAPGGGGTPFTGGGPH